MSISVNIVTTASGGNMDLISQLPIYRCSAPNHHANLDNHFNRAFKKVGEFFACLLQKKMFSVFLSFFVLLMFECRNFY